MLIICQKVTDGKYWQLSKTLLLILESTAGNVQTTLFQAIQYLPFKEVSSLFTIEHNFRKFVLKYCYEISSGHFLQQDVAPPHYAALLSGYS